MLDELLVLRSTQKARAAEVGEELVQLDLVHTAVQCAILWRHMLLTEAEGKELFKRVDPAPEGTCHTVEELSMVSEKPPVSTLRQSPSASWQPGSSGTDNQG